MAKLPQKLSLIRPLILFLRKVIWKILGAYNTADVIRKIGPFPPPEPVDNGLLRLNEGDEVTFDVEDGAKGPAAVNLQKTSN